MSWETLKNETILKTPRFDVIKEDVLLPNGSVKAFYQTKLADCAIIMPVTPDGKLVLLNEYRHACRQKLISLPGGNIEQGDTPLETAVKELKEETGYTAEQFEFVQSVYADPPRTERRWHFFIAHNATPTSVQDLTEFEDIEILLMRPDELMTSLRDGSITNLPDMGLLYLGLHALGLLKF